ncbi:unnamed protein product, partial [Lymnaea stagnalis]
NCYKNSTTQNCTELSLVTLVDVSLFIFACLLAAFICAGNALAICAIWKTPSLRTLPNMYVASLAFADFVVGLGCVLLALFLLPPTRVALFFRYINLCVLMQGLNLGMTAVSVCHMALISVDRFLYITRPYLYDRVLKPRRAVVVLAAIWLFGVVYSFLPQFIYKPYGPQPLCDVTLVLPIGYLFYSSSSIYFSLVVVIMAMYSVILHTAFRQQKAITAITHNIAGINGELFVRTSLRSVKFFIIVFGVFFICLTPVVCCMAVDYYVNVPGDIYRLLNLLALTNSGMNFVIFAVLKKQFRWA